MFPDLLMANPRESWSNSTHTLCTVYDCHGWVYHLRLPVILSNLVIIDVLAMVLHENMRYHDYPDNNKAGAHSSKVLFSRYLISDLVWID